jgi:superfamily II DNA or RNA helicase
MKRKKKQASGKITIPPAHDWRTTDADEINRRRLRAQNERFVIRNTEAHEPVFSRFRVQSGAGMTYSVEIRDVAARQFACECVDFAANGLGTCKHVEAVLLHLQARLKAEFKAAVERGPGRAHLVPDPAQATLRLTGNLPAAPRWLRRCFDADGSLLPDHAPEELLERLREEEPPSLCVSQAVAPWLEARHRAAERRTLRREYEQKVQSGEWPAHETLSPLFPYQREGMLHLAFTERALLADEMGLGKTIQAIAACALLRRLGKARRVLVITPASLKSEWEEQIQRFTTLDYQLVYGKRFSRLACYREDAPFFTVANFEQMVRDALDVNERLQPDVIVLDEAQRIKNWNTKTSQAVKRLRSRYAFVLTGTPIENRIDELHSLMNFLDPTVLGTLFRFNRDFYQLDERGKPEGYRNLDVLHERIRPYLLRRRKADVETELPGRTDRNYFVPLNPRQRDAYGEHEQQVSRLMHAARRRALTQQEQDKLMRELAMMRMICDTNFILNPEDRSCPKLAELEKVLEECRDNPQVKVLIFSEWEKMLTLAREVCERLELGSAWHTGSVPQQRRRGEINRFKNDPDCRVFLSTDAGATGLNLQSASIVINCDLPWNPAKLEQRIARAWRKHQTRAVTVVNLISENTIEHRMLATLADKKALAGGVLDREGDLKELKLRGGRQAMLERLEQILSPAAPPKPPADAPPPTAGPLPADRPRGFAEEAARVINGALVRCEERYPLEGAHSVLVVVVEREAAQWRERLTPLHEEYFDGGDPLSPVHLEVFDRATHEAIDRLIATGLLAPASRGVRPLFPAPEEPAAPPALSDAERARIAALRDQAARKLKAVRVLGEAGLLEEARPALLDAILLHSRALAAAHRLPEPEDVAAALLPPLARYFDGMLPALRSFVAEDGGDWRPAAEALLQDSKNAQERQERTALPHGHFI